MRKVIFVTYASGPYKKNIFWNKVFIKLFIRPDKAIFLTDEDLKKSNEYFEHRSIFDSKVGAGYWAWKPWAINEAYKNANEGDIIIYQDCGRGLRFKNFVFPRQLIAYAEKFDVMPGVLVPEHGKNIDWTHKECFQQMGCDFNEFHTAPQVEAVISVWKVCQKSSIVLTDWKRNCLNENVISDKYLDKHALYGIKGHRYDQSILTNLVIKHQLKPLAPEFISLHLFKSLSVLELVVSKRMRLVKLIIKLNLLKKVIKNKMKNIVN